MGTQGAVAIVQADAPLPGSPFAVVYMVKATAIALETANAGLAPQKAEQAAMRAMNPEIDGPAFQVHGLWCTTYAAVVTAVAVGR